MGKKLHHTLKGVSIVPKGQPFVILWLEVFCSDAWSSMSINCRRLIDFLIIEHLNHNGTENGFLIATYEQLQRAGINKRFINGAIKEAETKGLIHIEYGFRNRGLVKTSPNIFTLTFLPIKVKNKGAIYYTEPSNDWKKFKN